MAPTGEDVSTPEGVDNGRAAAYMQTVSVLDQTSPGWRCGDPTTDGMTVILATGIRQVLSAIFPKDAHRG